MDDYGYGLWVLVVVNSLVFIVFAASFFHPQSRRDWRVLGGFSAFVIALFTEMYGYPLTIYLLTGPLGGLIPGVDLSHDSGHLWTDLIGWKGNPLRGADTTLLPASWPSAGTDRTILMRSGSRRC